MNQIVRPPAVTVLPPETRNPNGIIRADAMYTMREAAAFVRLPAPALRELLSAAGVTSVKLKNREYIHGASIFSALEATQ
jgi:hypothetical protein